MTKTATRTRPKALRAEVSSNNTAETRERLIAVARELFADRGFARVTVRDICNTASANVAAVSYHFGDKLGLYREVVRDAIEAMKGATEVIGGTPGASPEEQFRQYIRTFLPRVAKPSEDKQWIGKLLTHEMADPTPIAQYIIAEGIMPRIMYLRGIVAALLEVEVTDARVAYCVTSVQAQCLFYRPDRFKSVVAPGWAPADDAAVAAIADHVAQFSLAGIKAIKRDIRRARGA